MKNDTHSDPFARVQPDSRSSSPEGRPEAGNESPVLEVTGLRTEFSSPQGVGQAVNGVSFHVARGETLGLVGESGSGKSMTALSILRLVPRHNARIVAGQVLYKGTDLLRLSESEMRRYRGRCISMILQDPMSALNPVLSIGEQLFEPLRTHQHLKHRALRDKAVELLRLLRVPAAETRLNSYPHEFSGGMRQRVVGAIALACEPDVLIADEPTTSLDVTIQAQYLKLLRHIQRSRGVSIIFITHDFGIVAKMCDRVAVMYAGRIVEQAPVEELFAQPMHPYTRALLNSLPTVGADRKQRLYAIEGHPPSIYQLPVGCAFADRCEHADEHCRAEYPHETEVSPDHTVSCWKHA